MDELQKKLSDSIWIGKSLFQRGKVSGSTANLSFKDKGKIYITGTGGCFGRLSEDEFAIVKDDIVLSETRPSKELTIHKYMFESDESIKAIIHTHSTYITYWSCILEGAKEIKIPSPTPYLDMKVGKIGWVPYEKPGTEELFKAFKKSTANGYKAYVLEKHGVIVGAKTLMDAFYMLEEIEESAKNAWLLQQYYK